MLTLYDTATVAPSRRYDHYRDGAGTEFAPVTIHGPRPAQLSATMAVSRIGPFELEAFTWSADSEVVCRRTEQLIRANDPECYRLILNISARPRLEQAGNRVARLVNMSPRYLHRLFQDAPETPIQLVKRLRLEECHRSLQDPALATTPVREVIAAHGYLRQDQFARDFRRRFGVSATQVRVLGRATVR